MVVFDAALIGQYNILNPVITSWKYWSHGIIQTGVI